MASENHIYKMSNAGGFKSLTRYYDMLAGNTTWNPWEPTGAFDSLATITVPSGGASSVTFAGIPTGYKHLQIRFTAQSNRATYAIDDIRMRFNSDTAANYSDHVLGGEGSGVAVFAETSQTSMLTGYRNLASSAAANIFGVGIIDILDYSSTTKNKTIRSLSGEDLNGAVAGFYGGISLTSGLWMNSTTGISTINMFPEYGTAFNQYSQFALYGVK